jgi:Tol biopolymer transport system component
MQLSPDGKKVAFVVRGEVFAASAATAAMRRAFRTVGRGVSNRVGAGQSSLVYVSDRDGVPHLFLYDFSSNSETQLTRDAPTIRRRASRLTANRSRSSEARKSCA